MHRLRCLARRSQLTLSFLFACQSVAAQSDWPNVGNDKGAMRYSALDQINRRNVQQLKPAWSFRSGGLNPAFKDSAIQCTPIVTLGMRQSGSVVFGRSRRSRFEDSGRRTKSLQGLELWPARPLL